MSVGFARSMRVCIPILAALLAGAGISDAAVKYWVGDVSTSWNNAANWSASTGGPDGAVPVAGDVVIFDSGSGAANLGTVCNVAIGSPGVTIQIKNPPAAPSVAPDATLTLAAGTSVDMSAATQSFSLMNGTASIVLAGDATFLLPGGFLTITEEIDTNGHILTIQNDGIVNITAPIIGTGGFTKNGTNDILFSNLPSPCTYTGVTTINAGRIFTSDLGETFANTSDFVFADAVCRLSLGSNETIGSLSGGGATSKINLNGKSLTVTQDIDQTFAGIIYGAGDLAKYGPNKLTLTGANEYTGVTWVVAGTLNIQHNTATGEAGSWGVNVGAGASLELQGGITVDESLTMAAGGANELVNVSGSNTWSGAVTLTGTVDIATTANDLTIGGIIGGAGFGLTKKGAGTLKLSNTNTYTGTTSIQAGTLETSGADKIADGSSVALTNATGAIFKILGDETIASLSGGGAAGGNIDLGGNTLTVTQAADQTYAGVIDGTGGLTKKGASKLTLTGTNTYSGATSIDAGTLNLQDAAAAGTTAGGVTVAAGASLELQGGIAIGAESLTLNAGGANELVNVSGSNSWAGTVALVGGTVDVVTTAGDLTIGGVISGVGFGLTKTGAGTLKYSGTNTYSGTTSIQAGKLETSGADKIADGSSVVLANDATASFKILGSETIASLSGGGAAGGNIDLGGNTLTVTQAADLSYDGIISGTGGLTKKGASKLTLTGTNTYSGATSIDAGTLNLQDAAAAGTTAGGVTVAAGASLELQGGIAIGAESLTLNAGGANELVNVSGSNSWAGTVALVGGTVDVVTTAGDLTIGGVISGVGFGLTKTGAGTLAFSGTNTYSGTTSIQAGKLETSGADKIDDGSSVVLANDATASFKILGSETIASLSGGGAAGGNIDLVGNILTVTQAADLSYDGVISGTGALIKNGAGALSLGGVNTYSGATTVNTGIISFNGVNTGVSAVTVNNAAKLAGTGTIPGSVIMNGSSILAPGASNGDAVGTITISGDLTFNNTSKYVVTMTGGAIDAIIVGGNLSAGGGQTVQFQAGYDDSGLAIPATILDITGTYTAFTKALPVNYNIDDAKVGNLIRLIFTPACIPTLNEWGIILMSLLLAGAGVRMIRRRVADTRV